MACASDSDDNGDLLFQALPVGNLDNFDPSLPPASAEDYLKKVVWESRQYQDVKTVELSGDVIKKNGPLIKVRQKIPGPKDFIPSHEMQKDFLAQFSQLREKIEHCRIRQNIPKAHQKLPEGPSETAWCQFCFGTIFLNKINKNEQCTGDTQKLVEGQAPLLSILLNISSCTLEDLIEWHANWLEMAGFSEPQGRWLFSLLACLEKPLTPETCSVLRNILKMCATIRASLESKDHPHLIQLNMLITIISKYFNQDDLADK